MKSEKQFVTTSTQPEELDTSKLMLVRLEIGLFNPVRMDKKESEEVQEKHDVRGRAARVIKQLVPKDAIADLQTQAASIRQLVRSHSSVWDEQGYRLVRADRIDALRDKFKVAQDEWNILVNRFMDEWDNTKDQARETLGTLFHEGDYPSEKEIRERFVCRLRAHGIPSLGEIQNVAACYSDLMAENNERVMEAMSQARLEPLRELANLLKKASDRFHDPDAIFRNSLVENIQDFLDRQDDVVVIDDPDVEKVFKDVQAAVASYDPKNIRQDKTLRSIAADQTTKMVEQIEALVNRKLEI